MATLLASATRILWRILERNGVDPGPLFLRFGLNPSVLDDPRARYGVREGRRLWGEAARLIPDPAFGLQAAELWRPTDFHALGYAFLASDTLRTAVRRLERYHAVVDPVVAFTEAPDDPRLSLSYQVVGVELAQVPALEDARWAVLLGICRYAFGSNLDPVEVSFAHAAPVSTGPWFGLFRCPVQFGAPAPRLVFSPEDADRPLPARNRELAKVNDAVLAAYSSALTAQATVSRVKRAILDRLPGGTPTAEQVARDLIMSPRTLQRRLMHEGTSFKRLLEAVRQELAEQYIADPGRSLAEITYLLGFSEASAFSRAYRRWNGESPSRARGTLA
jgi:AraC-like DNA-binding protein